MSVANAELDAQQPGVASTQPRYQYFSVSYQRLAVVGLALVYYGVFASMYYLFVGDIYASLGFGFALDWSVFDVVVVTALAIGPALWIPVSFRRPSAVFIYFQYFFIYIPAIWMTRHSILPSLDAGDQALVSSILAVAMLILLWSHHRVPLIRFAGLNIKESLLWTFIYAFAGGLLVMLFAGFGSTFRLVALSDIYQLRDSANDVLESSGSVLLKYAFPWLNGLLLPLMFARAVSRRNYPALAGIVVCYIFLFGIWGAKASLFSPVILVVTSLWASFGPRRMPILMIIGITFAIAVPIFLPFEDGFGLLLRTSWVAIVDMRTFSIPGLAIPQYYDFFTNHPLTLGSHISGVNLLVDFPYDNDVPRTVGYYFYGQIITANANFWAQDGLASFGVVGVVLISFFAAGVLWILDSVTNGLKIRFVVTAMVGILLAFSNISIFTLLATGGLGIFILLCALMPRDAPDQISAL